MGEVPDGKITQFDKGQYDKLTRFAGSWRDDADGRLVDPKNNVDADLRFDAGAESFPPASKVMSSMHGFAGGVHDATKAISDDLDTFTTNLKTAADVFEDTNDLANVTIADFPFGSSSGTSTKT